MTFRALDHRDGVWRFVGMERPPLRGGQIRIRVVAAGVNRADCLQAQGMYAPPPGASPILGLEAAGEVIEVGPDVFGWGVGDRAVALLGGGGYAEEVVVAADHALHPPSTASWAEAAGFIEVFATAWSNLVLEAGLPMRPAGSSVLIHAGASGVGLAALHLCRLWGHPCFATVGSAAKLAAVLENGASAGAVRRDGAWAVALRTWRPEGVDVILDPVGSDYFLDNLSTLRVDGALVVIGLLGGRRAEVDLGRLLLNRLRIVGSTLRSRSDTYKAALVGRLIAEVVPHWADRRVYPLVDRTFSWEDAPQAHARMAANENIGKIVLEVHSSSDSGCGVR